MDSPFHEITGAVTAPRGFRAAAIGCGIKEGGQAGRPRDDLALIVSDFPAVGAATFTTNKIKAAPVRVSMDHLRSAELRGIIANSGNANACTGADGIRCAKRMTAAAAGALGWNEKQFLVCSTGRIGRELPIERIEKAVPELAGKLHADNGRAVARAIMTSDTFEKEIAIELSLAGKPVRIGGVAKGAGMINPDMATMLCFVTTDAAIAKRDLQKLFLESVEQSFNRITVDGDMSTNDTAICLANGQSGAELLQPQSALYDAFAHGLHFVTRQLARMIVEDGEGVSKFVEVHVKNAATCRDARKAAEAVANSMLVKCSWCGEDPNWGRVMDAVGYAAINVREEMVDIFYNGVVAAEHGMASDTPPEKLKEILRNKNFTVTIDLHLGTAEYKVFTTDLTTDYVKFNLSE
ncbi:MAG: bifunctional glutamate N-acetyltransferase/amino-acid acetyltransferase ArgJ [Verrucomicrobia bacterium]|nr:bifunctional glutamate N-acetyltransferase/amino-acid acetyltransferase ArgJ [Verrucomicrobiota bacterium]MBV9998842.1 bifunctional glutamate N-acetyltransferase/amino-acid acetyltransferase ArgJ [Verrucomicrobiota bacterium]